MIIIIEDMRVSLINGIESGNTPQVTIFGGLVTK